MLNNQLTIAQESTRSNRLDVSIIVALYKMSRTKTFDEDLIKYLNSRPASPNRFLRELLGPSYRVGASVYSLSPQAIQLLMPEYEAYCINLVKCYQRHLSLLRGYAYLFNHSHVSLGAHKEITQASKNIIDDIRTGFDTYKDTIDHEVIDVEHMNKLMGIFDIMECPDTQEYMDLFGEQEDVEL